MSGPVTPACLVCGATFASSRRDARYCGPACRQRARRRRQAAERQAPDEGYQVIVADPPWQYRQRGVQGAAEGEYDLMDLAALKALPVETWAARDAVLVMWATWPLIQEALELVPAWGFTYKSLAPWVKTTRDGWPRAGIGFWFRGCSEALIVATRGRASPPPPESRPLGLLWEPESGELAPPVDEAVLVAPRTRHSEKPDTVHVWLERAFPGPRLELFARRERPGWTCWGGDLGARLGPAGVEIDRSNRSKDLDQSRRAI